MTSPDPGSPAPGEPAPTAGGHQAGPTGPWPDTPGVIFSTPPPDLPPPAPGPRVPPPAWHVRTAPVPPPPPIDVPGTMSRLRSAQRAYAASLLGSVAVQLTSLPWSLFSGVFAAIGFGYGVHALVLGRRLRTAGVRTRGRAAVGVGLSLALLLVLQTGLRGLFYPVESDYEACRSAAQTQAAVKECQDRREQRLRP